MSWVNPRTWSAADLVTAAKMNEIRDTLRGASGARTTTVPSSPNDEDEWNYPVGNGVVWRFKYNSGSGSAYKWEFVGGGPALAGPGGSVTTTSSTPTNITSGPAFTPPRAGEYVVRYGLLVLQNNATGISPTVRLNASTSGVLFTSQFNSSLGAGGFDNYNLTVLATLVASETVQMQVYNTSNAGSGSWSIAWIEATPIRIS